MFNFENIVYPRVLIRGNPLQPLRLDFFVIDFTFHYHSQLPYDPSVSKNLAFEVVFCPKKDGLSTYA